MLLCQPPVDLGVGPQELPELPDGHLLGGEGEGARDAPAVRHFLRAPPRLVLRRAHRELLRVTEHGQSVPLPLGDVPAAASLRLAGPLAVALIQLLAVCPA